MQSAKLGAVDIKLGDHAPDDVSGGAVLTNDLMTSDDFKGGEGVDLAGV
jgi:hypothetical protein